MNNLDKYKKELLDIIKENIPKQEVWESMDIISVSLHQLYTKYNNYLEPPFYFEDYYKGLIRWLTRKAVVLNDEEMCDLNNIYTRFSKYKILYIEKISYSRMDGVVSYHSIYITYIGSDGRITTQNAMEFAPNTEFKRLQLYARYTLEELGFYQI